MKKVLSIFIILTLGLCLQSQFLCEAVIEPQLTRISVSDKNCTDKLIKEEKKDIRSKFISLVKPKVVAAMRFLTRPTVLVSMVAAYGLTWWTYSYLFKNCTSANSIAVPAPVNKTWPNVTISVPVTPDYEPYPVNKTWPNVTTPVPAVPDVEPNVTIPVPAVPNVEPNVMISAPDVPNVEPNAKTPVPVSPDPKPSPVTNAEPTAVVLDAPNTSVCDMNNATTTSVNMTELTDSQNNDASVQKTSDLDTDVTVNNIDVNTQVWDDCTSVTCDLDLCTKARLSPIAHKFGKRGINNLVRGEIEYLPKTGDCREKAFVYGYFDYLNPPGAEKSIRNAKKACETWFEKANGTAHVDYSSSKTSTQKIDTCYNKLFNLDGSPKYN